MIPKNLFAKQKETHRHIKHKEDGRRDKLGVWDNIHTLLYIKQIISKDLLYSTRNYIQYFVITYKGKESEKKYV